jgi:ATP-dependent RNA helicase SUPV3L1/SUV3
VLCAPDQPADFFEAIGYPVRGGLAVRADILERVAAQARQLGRAGAFCPAPEMLSLLGLGVEPARRLLLGLGFQPVGDESGAVVARTKPRRSPGNGVV